MALLGDGVTCGRWDHVGVLGSSGVWKDNLGDLGSFTNFFFLFVLFLSFFFFPEIGSVSVDLASLEFGR